MDSQRSYSGSTDTAAVHTHGPQQSHVTTQSTIGATEMLLQISRGIEPVTRLSWISNAPGKARQGSVSMKHSPGSSAHPNLTSCRSPREWFPKSNCCRTTFVLANEQVRTKWVTSVTCNNRGLTHCYEIAHLCRESPCQTTSRHRETGCGSVRTAKSNKMSLS